MMKVITLLCMLVLAICTRAYAVDDKAACLVQTRKDIQQNLDKLARDAETAAKKLSATGLTGPEARKVLKKLCSSSPGIIDCTAVTADGRMVTVEPAEYRKFEGSDISKQEQMVRLRKTRKPVMSLQIHTVEGILAVDIEHPIFSKDGKFIGSVSILFDPGAMVSNLVDATIKKTPLKMSVMQKDSEFIYDTLPRYIGKRFYDDELYKNHPEVREFLKDVIERPEGAGVYRFGGQDSEVRFTLDTSWTTVSLHGTEWRIVLSKEVPYATPTSKEGFIEVKGGKIYYRIVGAEKSGVPLLVLHGGPGSTHDYLEPLQALAEERPVIFYDQLGGGRSDRPKNTALWTVERFVDELATVREVLDLKKVHILGHSWGTMLLSSYMIEKKPVGVVSIIMAGPAVSAKRFAADQRALLKEIPAEMQRAIEESEARGDYQSPEYQKAMNAYYKRFVCNMEPWPECLKRSFETMGTEVYQYMWGPSEFTVTGTLGDFDMTNRLKEITVPTLWICGDYDEATPATTRHYQSMQPGSEIAVVADATHSVFLEHPETFNKLVRDFMFRTEGGTSIR